MYLEKRGYKVIVAGNGIEGLKKANYIKPDIILLDIEMPGLDGFEVCKEIRKKMNIPVVFISCRNEVMDKVKCFQIGGDDYLTKPFDFAELEARIQANIRQYKRSNQYITKESRVVRQGKIEIDLEGVRCYVHDELIELPIKEMKLLILLAKHPNQVWSQEKLYDHIWGFNHVGDVSTVKVHISRLRRKLEENPSNPQHILTVRGFGYMFETN